MALVREYDYKGKQITVSVNKDGNQYVGLLAIAGMTLPPAARQVEAESEDAALIMARHKAEELIDHPPPAAPSRAMDG